MSVQSQITRLVNAKTSILEAISEKGVAVSGEVLMDDIADLIRKITDTYLSVATDDEVGYLALELDGETEVDANTSHYISLSFN